MTATVTELYPSNGGQLPAGHLNGSQLALRAGVTYRRVDFWTRAGWLRPIGPARPGPGHQRAYPQSCIPLARLMGQLADAGFTPAAAHTHAVQLLERGTTRIAGITLHLPQP